MLLHRCGSDVNIWSACKYLSAVWCARRQYLKKMESKLEILIREAFGRRGFALPGLILNARKYYVNFT
jgi:hypothetical protein